MSRRVTSPRLTLPMPNVTALVAAPIQAVRNLTRRSAMRLHSSLLVSYVSLLCTPAAQAISLGDIGDEVSLYFNGPVDSRSNVGEPALPSLFIEANLAGADSGPGGFSSSAGLYSKALAHAGSVGAAVFLDWLGPTDSWGADATAATADVVTVSNPTFANHTVYVLAIADVNGGLSVAGPAANSYATASFEFSGIAGLAPFSGALNPYYLFDSNSGFGFAQVFSDRGYMSQVDTLPDGTGIYQSSYDYSPRWSSWEVAVALDAAGKGTFSTMLSLAVSGGEDGTCASLTYEACSKERGSGASDYSHTAIGHFAALTSGTSVSTSTGWAVSAVPLPPSLWLMVSGLAVVAGIVRRRAGQDRGPGKQRHVPLDVPA